jgi:hypothetical protein
MRVYRELKLLGSEEKLEQVIEEIEKILDNGWYRDKQEEIELSSCSMLNPMYCFICSETKVGPACSLVLAKSQDGDLYAANIVLEKVGELSYDEYNFVLEEFHQRFVVPASKKLDLEVVLSKAEVGINDFMSSEVAELLRKFSASAHWSNAASHPLDEPRWYAFVVAAHKEKALLDASTLRRLLIEEENWSEDRARRLSSKYESARSLLDYYDKNR